MRPPHPCTFNPCFLAKDAEELIALLGEEVGLKEKSQIQSYVERGLPPITSRNALATMLGYNPGFIWALIYNPKRHYRTFKIPKGDKMRTIQAPRIALKTIQKWLSVHFERAWIAREEVFGFVPGRSHIAAAAKHVGCQWVVSLDIKDFFPSVSTQRVEKALRTLGYRHKFSIDTIVRLTCYESGLAQGAPSSPVLSNIALGSLDTKLAKYAAARGFTFTRYADDVVFSGKEGAPSKVCREVAEIIQNDGWKIARNKRHVAHLPKRLKVHGLLVSGNVVRLTKGYRNKIRTFRHLLEKGKVKKGDLPKILGHIAYANAIERYALKE